MWLFAAFMAVAVVPGCHGWRWTKLAPGGTAVSRRLGAAATLYQPAGTIPRMVLCGGRTWDALFSDCSILVPPSSPGHRRRLGAEGGTTSASLPPPPEPRGVWGDPDWTWLPVVAPGRIAGRADHVSLVTGDHLLLYGGNTTSPLPATPDVLIVGEWKPDVLTNITGTIPVARYGHTAVATPQASSPLWVVFGGRAWEDDVALNDVVVLSLGDGVHPDFVWTTPETVGPTPAARYMHAAAVYKDFMYVVGGVGGDGTILSDLSVLTISGPGIWTWAVLLTTPLTPLYGHQAVVVNSLLCVFGGLTVGDVPDPLAQPSGIWMVDVSQDTQTLQWRTPPAASVTGDPSPLTATPFLPSVMRLPGGQLDPDTLCGGATQDGADCVLVFAGAASSAGGTISGDLYALSDIVSTQDVTNSRRLVTIVVSVAAGVMLVAGVGGAYLYFRGGPCRCGPKAGGASHVNDATRLLPGGLGGKASVMGNWMAAPKGYGMGLAGGGGAAGSNGLLAGTGDVPLSTFGYDNLSIITPTQDDEAGEDETRLHFR